ncbi:MAG: sodium:solute symporter family protein [Paludisphaera borealis]|uniref:sodium:solute symporter family protein n=1 Tax=Paludisphaera borealis TaxID=1387353 RepID=UPI00284ECEEC|nr:sodium:solute symporter family protein [Paludisphaera borealis]MDR3622575.1 sodium:solute symporter family protein [Paludisphaera borealis]
MHTTLAWIDYLIMVIYFAFVLGIGFALKRYMKTSADFFLSGRSIPAWVAGLAFISANLGAQEVIGMAASGAKYGLATSHLYWLGAIPAMAFVGIFMMPFYYGSRARSVPEYLRLRFDEKTRGLNAIAFALMTVMSSGISMYAMALLIENLHIFDSLMQALGLPMSWIFHLSIVVAAIITLGYVYLGGLTSAIYNEVLQFFLIVAGFFPLVLLGLKNVGGWDGLVQKVPNGFTHVWQGMTSAETSPLGVEVFGLAMGLGFVLSFGYWCTDFLVVQRAMAADSMSAARRTPLIAAVPKMIFPFLVILPGLIAVSLPTPAAVEGTTVSKAEAMGKGIIPAKLDASGEVKLDTDGKPVLDYDRAIPNMLLHYLPTGMLGLGLTALLASFMSGMAGNITAFNTVWTFDIYQAYIKPQASDKHYLWMGHFATLFGTLVSIAAAYVATSFNNIMDLLQLVFACVNAPLLATFLLGMFWKRATANGAFYGLLAGITAAAIHHGVSLPQGSTAGVKGGWISYLWSGVPITSYRNEMAQNFWAAIYAWTVCFVVTIVVSFFTKPHREEDLTGLVYSLTPRIVEHNVVWYKKPEAFGVVVVLAAIALNVIFR